MTKKFTFILFLLAALILTACGGEAQIPTEAVTAEYTVSLRSAGNMPLSQIEVYIYSGDTLEAFGHDHKDRILAALQEAGYNATITVTQEVF